MAENRRKLVVHCSVLKAALAYNAQLVLETLMLEHAAHPSKTHLVTTVFVRQRLSSARPAVAMPLR
jgi:hypothetical protein